jgi:hypothetical protein
MNTTTNRLSSLTGFGWGGAVPPKQPMPPVTR